MEQWTMRHGQKINIDEMSDTHAVNALKMLAEKATADEARAMLTVLCREQRLAHERKMRRDVFERLGGPPNGELARQDYDRMIIDEMPGDEISDAMDIGFDPNWDLD